MTKIDTAWLHNKQVYLRTLNDIKSCYYGLKNRSYSANVIILMSLTKFMKTIIELVPIIIYSNCNLNPYNGKIGI